MPVRLDSRDDDFEARFAALLLTMRESSDDVGNTVAKIIAEVRARGDDAVVELTNKFDNAGLTTATLRFTDEEIDAAIVEDITTLG